MPKKKPLKHQISYKENVRDVAIYNYLEDNIKDTFGISVYIKMLVEKDMREKEKWKWD